MCSNPNDSCSKPNAPVGFHDLESLGSGDHPRFRARCTRTGDLVFLKRCRNRRAAVREHRTLRRARSPFTPSPRGLVRGPDGETWLVVEWVEGTSLDRVSRPDPAVLTEIARALVCLHRRGIVHGDIKPANVIVPVEGPVRIIDLDAASLVAEVLESDQVGGTPPYTAPERRPGWPADPRSDVHALGRLVAAVVPEPAWARALEDRLTRHEPGQRPSAEAVVDVLAKAAGPGRSPAMFLLGRDRAPVRLDEAALARHIGHGIGVPPDLCWELAHRLLELLGDGSASLERAWKAWLPQLTTDPWGHVDPDRVRHALPMLRSIAVRVIRTEQRRRSLDERRAASLWANLGPSFGQADARTLADRLRRRGRVRESSLLEPKRLRRSDLLREEGGRFRFTSLLAWEVARGRPGRRDAGLVDLTRPRGDDPASLEAWTHRMDARGRLTPTPDVLSAAERLHMAGRHRTAVRVFERAVRGGRHTREGRSQSLFTSHRLYLRADLRPYTWPYLVALKWAGQPDAAEAALMSLRRRVPRPTHLAEWWACRAEIASYRRRLDEQVALAEEGLSRANDPTTLGWLTCLKGSGSAMGANPEASVPVLRQAYRHSRAASDGTRAADALRNLGVARIRTGDPRRARRTLRLAARYARAVDNPNSEASVLLNLAVAVHATGGPASLLLEQVADDRRVARRHRLSALMNLTHLAATGERWEVAVATSRRAASLAASLQDALLTWRSEHMHAQMLLRNGRVAESERVCRRWLEGRETGVGEEMLGLRTTLWEGWIWYRGIPWSGPRVAEVLDEARALGNPELLHLCHVHRSMNDVLEGRPARLDVDQVRHESQVASTRLLALLVGAIEAARSRRIEEARKAMEGVLELAADQPGTRWRRAFALMHLLERAPILDPEGTWLRSAMRLARDAGARWIEARLQVASSHQSDKSTGEDT